MCLFLPLTQTDVLHHPPPSLSAPPSESNFIRDISLAESFLEAMPVVTDFVSHVTAQLEAHCRLMSSSAMIRVDLGFRISPRKKNEDEMEDEMEDDSKEKKTRGPGWLPVYGTDNEIRLFVNEVTTTTDINLFAVRQQLLEKMERAKHRQI